LDASATLKKSQPNIAPFLSQDITHLAESLHSWLEVNDLLQMGYYQAFAQHYDRVIKLRTELITRATDNNHLADILTGIKDSLYNMLFVYGLLFVAKNVPVKE
jgi:hypothetical protein